MRDGSPSATAMAVAAYRLGFERLPGPAGDPGADERLARDVVAGQDFPQDDRIAGYLRVRTAFFDRAVVNGLERGTTQVAVIGAGYDGRGLRYAKPGVRWFELDHPATQSDKRERLERLAIPTPDVTFVAADLVGDDVAGALVEAGFAPDAPSLLLFEGVAPYLDPAVLGRVLTELRSVATAGTRLAMSGRIPSADPARREQFAARIASVGEPAKLGGADVGGLLAAARWREAQVSDRARRAGLIVGLPVWEPGPRPTVSRVGAYLERTFHRSDLDGLGDHLAATYGIAVSATRRLDVGVVRVDRADGPAWVARILPATRPADETRGDADVLRFLSGVGYPAERIAHPDPVSEHAGQAVLVTQLVDGRPPRPTQATFRQLGDLLGRLHTLRGAPARPGGAWHHLASGGGPDAEIAALRDLLGVSDERRGEVAALDDWALLGVSDELRGEVAALDDLHDLPQSFTHPDFVAANALVGAAGSPVIVDWTGAGVAPRLWTLAFLLWSAGLSGPRHVEAAVAGYRGHISLAQAELDRLEPAVGARPLIFDAWSVATGRRPVAEVTAGRAEVNAKARRVADIARAAFARPARQVPSGQS